MGYAPTNTTLSSGSMHANTSNETRSEKDIRTLRPFTNEVTPEPDSDEEHKILLITHDLFPQQGYSGGYPADRPPQLLPRIFPRPQGKIPTPSKGPNRDEAGRTNTPLLKISNTEKRKPATSNFPTDQVARKIASHTKYDGPKEPAQTRTS